MNDLEILLGFYYILALYFKFLESFSLYKTKI